MVQEPEFLKEKPKNTPKRGQSLVISVVIATVGLVALVSVLAMQLMRTHETRPTEGEIAPSFSLTSYDSVPLNLEDLRGQIVVVNVWASWCAPCHAEAPDLNAIHDDYGDQGVVLIGVNWLDVEGEARKFIERYRLQYANAPDSGEQVYETYNVDALPETFVIGRDGRIAAAFVGQIDYDTLARTLDTLLGGDA